MFNAPTSTAPAASIRRTSAPSRRAGGCSRLIRDPARVANPATSNRFLTANGTPANGPGSRPAATAASTASAVLRARSATTSVNALITGLAASIRASAAAVSARAVTRPVRDVLRDRARRPHGRNTGPYSASSFERKTHDQLGRGGERPEIHDRRFPPLRLQRNPEQRCCRIDRLRLDIPIVAHRTS